jgi:hypothetical protein
MPFRDLSPDVADVRAENDSTRLLGNLATPGTSLDIQHRFNRTLFNHFRTLVQWTIKNILPSDNGCHSELQAVILTSRSKGLSHTQLPVTLPSVRDKVLYQARNLLQAITRTILSGTNVPTRRLPPHRTSRLWKPRATILLLATCMGSIRQENLFGHMFHLTMNHNRGTPHNSHTQPRQSVKGRCPTRSNSRLLSQLRNRQQEL